MSECVKCDRVRMVLSQFWTQDEIDEIFNTPHFLEEPPVTQADVAEHNRRIAELERREPA